MSDVGKSSTPTSGQRILLNYSQVWHLEISLRFFLKFNVTCMSVLLPCMYVRHVCAWCPQKSEEGVESSEAGAMDDCEPARRCWELSPSPL